MSMKKSTSSNSVLRLLLIIWWINTANLFSQAPDFTNFGTKEGLLSDEVYNLFQDHQGYIWIFSKYGTLKYNGTGFKPVLINLPFKDSFIFSIYENQDGKKWVANSNAKIYEVRNDSAFIIKGIESVSSDLRNSVSEIVQLCADDSLNLYALTKGASFKLVRKTNSYHAFDLSISGEKDTILILALEINKNLLYIPKRVPNDEFIFSGLKNRVYLQLPNNQNLIKLDYSRVAASFRHLKKFGSNYYFSYSTFLGKIIDGKRLHYIDIGSIVLNFTKDRQNHLWVACLNDGLYELNEKDSVINHYFSTITINDVLLDFQGGLWASSSGMGLYRLTKTEHSFLKNQELYAHPLSFIKVIKDKLVLASTTGDISYLKQGKEVQIRHADNNTPLDVVEQRGTFVAAFNYRTEQLNLTNDGVSKIYSEESTKHYRLFAKGDDTLIYVWRRGLSFAIRGVVRKLVDFNQKLVTAELIDNVLWLGTENGPYYYKPVFTPQSFRISGEVLPEKDQLLQRKELEPLKNTCILKILKDHLNIIWFCTEGEGLFSLNKKNVTHYSSENGLPSNIINSIDFSSDNRALLATNKGLFLSKTEPNHQLFTTWEKIFSGEVKTATFFENRIYLSARTGLEILDLMKDAEKKLFFSLVSIQIDSKDTDPKNFKELKSDAVDLNFNFDEVTFEKQKPEIGYQLVGPSADSGSVTESIIRFSRLDPGNYTLTAFPRVKNGQNLLIQIPFVVQPAFWQTKLFWILLSLLFLSITAGVIWLIIKYNRKKQLAKTKNEQLILEYKLIALKAQINPHFMSNCLSAIQNLIMNNQSERATFYVARFGLMVRQILDFSSKPLITLGEELDLVRIYLELEQLRFRDKFNFKILVENDISLSSTSFPPLLLNPLIENAVWHGLLPLRENKKGELMIQVRKEHNCLHFSIKDNGVGRSVKKEAIGNNSTKSYGVKLTEQRLYNLNYLYGSNHARLNFEDLKDECGESLGTVVTVCVPLNLNVFPDDEN
ncbi:MAG: histidine kinase [bacterium]|nr:histidine kinase [bacterium]